MALALSVQSMARRSRCGYQNNSRPSRHQRVDINPVGRQHPVDLPYRVTREPSLGQCETVASRANRAHRQRLCPLRVQVSPKSSSTKDWTASVENFALPFILLSSPFAPKFRIIFPGRRPLQVILPGWCTDFQVSGAAVFHQEADQCAQPLVIGGVNLSNGIPAAG